MIKIKMYRQTNDSTIRSFSIKGHADYDQSGKDIVCAGVSAIAVGTVNSIEALTGVVLNHQTHHGLLKASRPDFIPQDQLMQVNLLLESMLVMLQTIEHSYGKYVAIQEIYMD